MARVNGYTRASQQDVWDVLASGWLYSAWVVGTAHIRQVDETWPQVGSKIHHSVGFWPLLLDDVSEVLEVDPPRRILLRAHGWPVGSAHIELVLTPQGDAASATSGTAISLDEEPVQGPGTWLHVRATDRILHARNLETLKRLVDLVENRVMAGQR